MDKNRIIDFSEENNEIKKSLNNINEELNCLKEEFEDKEKSILNLEAEVLKLYRELGIETPELNMNFEHKHEIEEFNEWQDQIIYDYDKLNEKVYYETHKNVNLLPKLDALDITVIGITALIATTLDLLLVKVPKDINYMGKFKQEGSPITEFLRGIGVDEDGKLQGFFKWCEEKCKVPYDKSTLEGVKGFYPKTHRLLNPSHDPLFGLIFAIFDIWNGSITAFDVEGGIHIVKNYSMDLGDKVLAPLLWIGHLVSDLCTSMGLPIPGWGFTQLMQFGKIGPNNRTVADITRFMYLNGYDLRHFATMSISAGSIEIVIRAYDYLRNLKDEESVSDPIFEHEFKDQQNSIKLHKMLFLSHLAASSGNILKVFLYHGNPLAINLPQWILLLKESIIITKAALRDTTLEVMTRNREKIDREWELLNSYYEKTKSK